MGDYRGAPRGPRRRLMPRSNRLTSIMRPTAALSHSGRNRNQRLGGTAGLPSREQS
jgi:hypothetical protein